MDIGKKMGDLESLATELLGSDHQVDRVLHTMMSTILSVLEIRLSGHGGQGEEALADAVDTLIASSKQIAIDHARDYYHDIPGDGNIPENYFEVLKNHGIEEDSYA